MNNDRKFAIGQLVEWTSSAAGTTKTKRGKVVAVVPAQVSGGGWLHLFDLLGNDWKVKHGLMFTGENLARGVAIYPRNHESYFVSVDSNVLPNTYKRKPTLYWPRTSQLRKVDSDEQR